MNAEGHDWSKMEEKLLAAREELTRKKSARDVLEQELVEVKEKKAALHQQMDHLDKVRLLLQKSADHAREQAKVQLETGVTNALQYVFGPMFRFHIELDHQRGIPYAEFYVESEWEGKTIRNRPQEARGGGVVDLLSLALRISLLETRHLQLHGPLLLDEPGKHVSEDFVPRMVEFLRSISESFGRQIIVVTHNVDLTESADAIYQVRLYKGESSVQKPRLLDNESL